MKTAKIFQNGQSQAVRLPKEYRFEDDHVFIKKSGNIVMLIPAQNSWDSLINSLDKFTDDFMSERTQPEAHKRIEGCKLDGLSAISGIRNRLPGYCRCGEEN